MSEASTYLADLMLTPPSSSGEHKAVAVEHISDCDCEVCLAYEEALNAYWDADEAFQRGETDIEPEQPSQPFSHYCDTCQDPDKVLQFGGDVTHTVLIEDCAAGGPEPEPEG